MATMSLAIDDRLLAQLDTYAATSQVSRSEVVRNAIALFLPPAEPKKRGRPSKDQAGSLRGPLAVETKSPKRGPGRLKKVEASGPAEAYAAHRRAQEQKHGRKRAPSPRKRAARGRRA
jgi:hypothetical protein